MNLECSKRDESMKIKRLRREGFVPAVIYGKNLDESISIQIDVKALTGKKNDLAVGSQMQVVVDGESYSTMVKAVEFSPVAKTYLHFDFQVLTSGEKIKTSTKIHFINKEAIQDEGNVQEYLNVVEYEVLPKDMIESLDVDISGLSLGHEITVADLEISKDERFHILTPATSILVSLAPIQEVVLETEDTDQVAPEVEE